MTRIIIHRAHDFLGKVDEMATASSTSRMRKLLHEERRALGARSKRTGGKFGDLRDYDIISEEAACAERSTAA